MAFSFGYTMKECPRHACNLKGVSKTIILSGLSLDSFKSRISKELELDEIELEMSLEYALESALHNWGHQGV